MHTVAYENVLAKLKRGGRARLDGFFSDEFTGITPNERNELVDLFKADNDFPTLRLLLPEDEFCELLRVAIKTLDVQTNGYVSALISAYGVGAIENSIERLVNSMGGLPPWPLGTALSFLSSVTIPSKVMRNYSNALFAILSGKNTTSASMLKASNEILKVKGYVPRSVEFMDMSSRLQAKDNRVRAAALADLAARR